MKIDKKNLKEREAKLHKAETILKSEFVGIDDVITNVMNNVRVWYLFPQLQERPLVISLWGMTGCGKTSLVKRAVELLDIEKDMVYFNFAEIGEMNSWEIEDNLEEEVSNDKPNRVFVYDEFQYAATKSEDGMEKDNKSGLKPFWELLDTGTLHKRTKLNVIYPLKRLLYYLEKINQCCNMVVENGVWVNAGECLKGFNKFEMDAVKEVFNFNIGGDKEKSVNTDTVNGYDSIGYDDIRNEFFIRQMYLYKILSLVDSQSDYDSVNLMCNNLSKMSLDEIYEYVRGIVDKYSKGYDLNFRQSLIFVIGNLDEAYKVSYDVNPDMSPDQFHKITSQITIVDIKESLRKRFRNEQIARLGNIMMIYPSFTSESFRKIIDIELGKYAKNAKAICGYDIEFDDTIKDIIFDDSVFPTHGTRPIFSSIYEIVKTKLPSIINYQYTKRISGVKRLRYTFNREENKTYVQYVGKNGSIIGKAGFDENLHVVKLRVPKKDEYQALVAVHESGHFVVYSKLFGKMPEKLCSKTASTDASGFLMRDSDDCDKVESCETLMKNIMVLLAGYVAEGLIFGREKRSNGASEDLSTATVIASNMVRKYGMGSHEYVTTYLTSPDASCNGGLVKEDSDTVENDAVKAIIDTCYEDVKNILKSESWNKMLRESSKFLAENSNMPKEKMEEIYSHVPDSEKVQCGDDGDYYRKIVSEL